MTKRRKILLVVAGVWLLYAVITMGGFVVWTWSDFGGQRDVELAPALKSDIWLEPTMSEIGVPLLVYVDTWKPPYAVRLQIWDSEARFTAIEVTEILVAYTDGEVVRLTAPWRRDFERYSSTVPEARKMIGRIEGVVRRHAGCTVTLVGSLTSADGRAVPFRASETFHPRSGRKTQPWLIHASGV